MTERALYPFMREPDQGDVASEMVVDITSPGTPTLLDGVLITDLDNGEVEIDFDGGEGNAPLDPAQAPFDANLAEYIDESELDRIGQEVCEATEADLESRQEWLRRFQKGMELLGVVESSANLGVLRHAKEVSHPLIAEAIVQYQARAIAEHFPPEGPVKTVVVGKKTPEREQQADRAGGYMNYQLMVEDRTYFAETDQGYFLQGMEGSFFKKVYRDELTRRNVSRLVMARDFIVPYWATSLHSAPRYTHILPYSQNDVRKLQAGGFYRECELSIPTGEPAQGHESAVRAQDKLEGKQPSEQIEEDRPHLVYEQHREIDLKGFEDVDQETGETTGIELPYIVHVDRDSMKVLAIYRNWEEQDPQRAKRVRFAHYKLLPGPGFYGLGFIHIIGGLGAAATGILRLIMVTAAFAGAGGGFKTKEGAKVPGSIEVEPGVFKDLSELSHDELKKAFFQPDFKQPPEALFKVLGLVTEAGKSFASTTEAMTGEGPATGPVGTMVALIEQGSKVYSGVHLRSHMAAGEEYRLLAELNGEYLPDESEGGYPYEVPGEDRSVFAEDFGPEVDVVPVSDPNIFSATQRIAIGQTLLELADRYPGDIARTPALRRFLAAMRVPDIDELLIKREIPRYDPVTENAMLILGRPVRAHIDQDHEAHMMVLGQVLQDTTLPDPVKAGAAAHYAEHQAMKWMAEASQMMGLNQAIPLDLSAEPGEPMAQIMPPQIERVVSRRAAMAINKLRPPKPSAEEQQVQGDLALKKQRVEGELKIKAWQAQAEAKLKLVVAKLDAAVERQVAFARLSMDREMGIRGMEQQGQLDKAKSEREALTQERGQVDKGVTDANAEFEAAIKALAEGMEAVVQIVESRTGGADANQPA